MQNRAKGGIVTHTIELRSAPKLECYVRVQLYDEACESYLANTEYTLIGETTASQIDGKTDDKGLLYHESLPDDHYTIKCSDSASRPVQSYYMIDPDRDSGKPSFIRMQTSDDRGNMKGEK